MALGYINYGKNKNNPLPHKARINKVIENAEIQGCVHGVNTYLTEDMLYDFMLEANTKKVKPFRKWVVKEVLPSIRKNGGYVQENREEEFIDKMFPTLSEETKLMMVKELQTSVMELQPKANYHDKVLNAPNLLTTTVIAQDLGTSAVMINRYLMAKKIQYKKSGNYNLYEKYQGNDYVDFVTTEAFGDNVKEQMKWTHRGKKFIFDVLDSDDLLIDEHKIDKKEFKQFVYELESDI